MIDKFIPDMYQKSIYSINYDKLKADGIKCLLFDLDNTCAAYSVKEPTSKLIELFEDLKDMDFKVIIYSNNTKKRLEPFKNKLLVDCSANSRKPRKDKFLKIMKMFNFDLSEIAIIGDQLLTDIYGGNRVGIKTILVNPVSKEDIVPTMFSRLIEKRLMKKMHKRGIFTKGQYYE